jgi:hypothetical protein
VTTLGILGMVAGIVDSARKRDVFFESFHLDRFQPSENFRSMVIHRGSGRSFGLAYALNLPAIFR